MRDAFTTGCNENECPDPEGIWRLPITIASGPTAVLRAFQAFSRFTLAFLTIRNGPESCSGIAVMSRHSCVDVLSRARHRHALCHFCTLAIAVLLLAPAGAYAQSIVDPATAEFDPSADHNVTVSGVPVVDHYEIGFYLIAAAQPFQINQLGKPSPASDGKIRVALGPRPGAGHSLRGEGFGRRTRRRRPECRVQHLHLYRAVRLRCVAHDAGDGGRRRSRRASRSRRPLAVHGPRP